MTTSQIFPSLRLVLNNLVAGLERPLMLLEHSLCRPGCLPIHPVPSFSNIFRTAVSPTGNIVPAITSITAGPIPHILGSSLNISAHRIPSLPGVFKTSLVCTGLVPPSSLSSFSNSLPHSGRSFLDIFR